jgi:hypothetical protein
MEPRDAENGRPLTQLHNACRLFEDLHQRVFSKPFFGDGEDGAETELRPSQRWAAEVSAQRADHRRARDHFHLGQALLDRFLADVAELAAGLGVVDGDFVGHEGEGGFG